MRLRIAIALVAVLALSGCATAPPLPSRAAFSEQVIEPLADKKTDERLQYEKARARQDHVSGKTWLEWAVFRGLDRAALSNGLPPAGSFLERFVDASPEKQYQETLAWLDTQGPALKKKYSALLESRIADREDAFSVCLDGKERRYARQAGFPRLDDGSGPCPPTQVLLNE